MTITPEERALVRKCMETIKAMRKMGLDRGGGTTATEDNLSRVVPKLLDALEAAERDHDALQGIVDDIASETGHCLLLNDEEHEAPPLPDWVRGIARERDALKAKLDEREGDMHDRIRAGYDATVADSWRVKVADVERERDAALAELEACKAKLAALVEAVESDKLPLMMTVRAALAAAKETP